MSRIPTLGEIEAKGNGPSGCQVMSELVFPLAHQAVRYEQLLATNPIKAKEYKRTFARLPMTPEQIAADKAARVRELDLRLQNAMGHKVMTLPMNIRELVIKVIEHRRMVNEVNARPMKRRI